MKGLCSCEFFWIVFTNEKEGSVPHTLKQNTSLCFLHPAFTQLCLMILLYSAVSAKVVCMMYLPTPMSFFKPSFLYTLSPAKIYQDLRKDFNNLNNSIQYKTTHLLRKEKYISRNSCFEPYFITFTEEYILVSSLRLHLGALIIRKSKKLLQGFFTQKENYNGAYMDFDIVNTCSVSCLTVNLFYVCGVIQMLGLTFGRLPFFKTFNILLIETLFSNIVIFFSFFLDH